ncbi:similar to Saccharomyces cerevisiae YPR057W BRR1 snRNP protein component of spliceosomal snRNPs, required for pre-mRNA splicing and snRNP biogenesis [Maudiozyma barnettii]|uniref:Similar to Saccharomyces cerevisiae YPR057W BRR1 snRNP protein component of spliceosomal snRNPs, required for pre-mRNA splicing and snRNP biogenesis n=1 Tax=Maudiozyma barnettii TaxID=61262 RepID=A0A8H2ZG88_9SACH|nr:Brr1p [Kazachstania barnettii]CAB4253084.1 similar to Saccharomyces cerevisiae YPR057W BRR1 snRNP protein component of spliceosomal snRNPs, required for pre-mRNA splicing and snRNP biogenesis [Kazachstania barnettii]CAD1780381.1 similar to Saccharomyces cerevisiae YPR057W BRR1 snRNP protein component of spliceosomal snRNPs, required for pre-mRNA splicing and snRNP biogenesis [Kazachstania barnettii]
MENKKSSASVDPTFGQAPVFALNDEDVNPLAIQYLKDVRREALTTNATNYKGVSQRSSKFLADIYDDEPNSNPKLNSESQDIVNLGERSVDDLVTDATFNTPDTMRNYPTEQTSSELPTRLKKFNENSGQWLAWFKKSKTKILDSAFTTQGYDDDILNLLLFYLKQHLNESKDRNTGIETHLHNLLKDHNVSDEILSSNSWTIDETWITPTLSRLRSMRIRDIDDIKACLLGDYRSKKPRNYDQWTRFIRENEPNSSMFTTMVTQDDIWIIFKFMKQNWLKVMMKTPENFARTGMWLLYSMFYLSEDLNSTQISTLRDFAKKCQRLYLDKLVLHSQAGEGDQISLHEIKLPSEMIVLGILPPISGLAVIELVMVVISQIFGQKDLVAWTAIVQMG